MELVLWIIIFMVALVILVKGADWALSGAERIGVSLGLSSFVVGVVIVGLGTSLPELVASLAAVFRGAPEIVIADVIGSNIANILLVGGVSAVIGGRLAVTKNLIDLDIPLLSVVSVLFLVAIWDRSVVLGEAILLLLSFCIYIGYTAIHREESDEPCVCDDDGVCAEHRRPIHARDVGILTLGFVGLVLGANYLIESVIHLSGILGVGIEIISLVAVALGTSLPELLVSVKAAVRKKPEVALGNIFGSNVFNLLFVAGISGLFGTLPIDAATFSVGLPYMLLATGLFVISGISRRIHVYEGAMYIVLYGFFIGQLLGSS